MTKFCSKKKKGKNQKKFLKTKCVLVAPKRMEHRSWSANWSLIAFTLLKFSLTLLKKKGK
jgi:hypothetical protein